MLKDSLLLACGYMITLFQCRAERFLKKSDVLNGELRKEKNFRTALQKRAVLNYIANLDQNRIVEGMEKFSSRLSQGLQGGHRQILERFIQACVHPQDQEALRAQLLFRPRSARARQRGADGAGADFGAAVSGKHPAARRR